MQTPFRICGFSRTCGKNAEPDLEQSKEAEGEPCARTEADGRSLISLLPETAELPLCATPGKFRPKQCVHLRVF